MKKALHHNNRHFNKISFYIVAHADDWQLFMQPNVYYDLVSPGCKVIIIIVTAGDSGKQSIYWKAREEGSKSSVRYCLASLGNLSESIHTAKFNAHAIEYSVVNNVTSYFLRLPDGNIDGSGFAEYNFQSLSKFKSHNTGSIQAIDGSSSYKSWIDFTLTLEAILLHESEGISHIRLNYLNPHKVKNPGDHADHIMVGQAIQNTSILVKADQYLFTGYSLSSGNHTLLPEDFFWKIGMFAVYEKAVYDICGYSTLAENSSLYKKWCVATPKVEILPRILL